VVDCCPSHQWGFTGAMGTAAPSIPMGLFRANRQCTICKKWYKIWLKTPKMARNEQAGCSQV